MEVYQVKSYSSTNICLIRGMVFQSTADSGFLVDRSEGPLKRLVLSLSLDNIILIQTDFYPEDQSAVPEWNDVIALFFMHFL